VAGFLGQYEFQLDQKGRVSLPAEYRRKADGSRFVLLQWERTHLTLFPEEVWEGRMAELLTLRREKPELASVLREVTSRAVEVAPDSQGRMLIPAWLKEKAGLDSAVLLIGALDRIELWNPEVFRETVPDDVQGDAEVVAEMHRIFG
jgi:MraZ protein